jgi:hypothetical protein
LADIESTFLGAVLLGAEKLVNLFEQLTAGAVIFVIDDHLHSISGGFDGGRQAGGSGSHTNHFISAHDLLRNPFRAISFLGFDDHTGLQRLYAGADVRLTVNDHDTIRAATDGAKHAPGLITARCIAVNQNTVAAQGNGDGFALKAFHGLPVKCKLDRAAFFKSSQNWVFFYAHSQQLSPYKEKFPPYTA